MLTPTCAARRCTRVSISRVHANTPGRAARVWVASAVCSAQLPLRAEAAARSSIASAAPPVLLPLCADHEHEFATTGHVELKEERF